MTTEFYIVCPHEDYSLRCWSYADADFMLRQLKADGPCTHEHHIGARDGDGPMRRVSRDATVV